MSSRSTEHGAFTIERTYPATLARVWSAWAEPEQKRRWFGPEALKREHELDFRVGGSERMTVGMPDGELYVFNSRFQDIVEHERIVHTYEMFRGEQRISVSVATIELAPAVSPNGNGDGEATKLTFTEQGVFLDGLDDPAEREHGTRELLGSLEAALREEPAGS